MLISRRIIRNWLLLFLPFLLMMAYFLFRAEIAETEKTYNSISRKIGTRFPISQFIDSSGNKRELKLTSDFTIIDFWFKSCKPCIEEMKQFNSLIKGREKKVSIVSVSTDPFLRWKEVFREGGSKSLAFLKDRQSNWEHFVYTNEDTISPSKELGTLLSIKYYPAYFVLNKKGEIVAAPASAVKFIQSEVLDESQFWNFVAHKLTLFDSLIGTLLGFVFYSGLFWIITIIFLSIPKRNVANMGLPKPPRI
jgi:peroxiredoxin